MHWTPKSSPAETGRADDAPPAHDDHENAASLSPGTPFTPHATTHLKGRAGEALAVAFLEARGYQIAERNFRTRRGEVDIIAVEGGTIAFCEVKSWERMPREGLEQAIDRRKQGRILRTSLCYLQQHPDLRRLQPRYDVLFVSPDGVEHFPDAFSERGAW